MILYPAVDIKDGKCVRLTQGKFDHQTVYGDDPVEMALKWAAMGAEFLHIVDLDGARTESRMNREIVKEIAKSTKIPVQTGGGIRTLADMEELLSAGVERVIIGTSAVREPQIVKEAVLEFGGHVAVGIDAKDGHVAVSGWEEVSGLLAVDLAKNVAKRGVKHIIFTDIATDGMLTGPNIDAMSEMTSAVPDVNVIASGGVGSLDDILSLKSTGVGGVIVGKALYTGKVELSSAIARLKG